MTIQIFHNITLAWSCDEKLVQPMVKHSFKVHVWAAINVKGKIGMHMFTKNLDHHLYHQILDNHLYNNANELLDHYWVFQQDNDLKHTSRDVQRNLKTYLSGRVLS